MNELNILNELSLCISYPKTIEQFDSINDDKLAPFKSKMDSLSLHEREELYTRTFDLNGPSCLDIGYVLFGEDYKRGEFLVGLKDLYRRIDYQTGAELFDHLPYVLEALARMSDTDERTALAVKIVIPGVEKIIEALNSGDQNQKEYLAPLYLIKEILMNKFIIGQRGLV